MKTDRKHTYCQMLRKKILKLLEGIRNLLMKVQVFWNVTAY
jgi:hypothetical protein